MGPMDKALMMLAGSLVEHAPRAAAPARAEEAPRME